MKHWLKILGIFILALIILYSAANILLTLKGKAIIARKLQEATHKKVSLTSLNILFPLNLEINDLDIEGTAKIKKLFIAPNLLYLLRGTICLSRVIVYSPEISYERLPEAKTDLTQTQEPAETTDAITTVAIATEVAKAKKPLHVVIKRLKVKNGKLTFTDKTVSAEGIRIALQDINLNVSSSYLFVRSAITNFELNAKIPWQEGSEAGKVFAEGWFNPYKKDMQAALKIENIDGVYLYPYYATWVDLEKAGIEKAKLSFTSNIQGLNNNVVADCRLELTDIVRKPRAADEPQEKAEKIADAVLEIFKALDQGKIVLNFKINTKMDRPEFNFGDIKVAFEDKLALVKKDSKLSVDDVLGLPVKLFQGTVKGATDISKAVIDGAFAVGNEIKKSVEGSFKKTQEE